MKRDVFAGIADPTRRAILGKLVKERQNLTAVGDTFDMSRQALTKHIRILVECGLVVVEREGRESYCRARLENLKEVSEWVAQYKKFWTESFDRLDDYLIKLQAKKKRNR